MKIVWTRLALNDINSAYEYIVTNNQDAALDTIERIEEAINRLLQYPQMGRVGQISGTRELVISRTPFIVPYRVRDDTLEILGVIHAARQWPERF
ncbi:MAG: type II toxin-antitoxin system RelE/ParE family toxin [Okeania sp. SIO2G4]|uniref:type II toxin-antitoxin system RelE/ParE family toxin n=1 Tax=unclassified Okeania TaxID=2634635 RepID=UPI0013B9ECCF|nr:MULTISPECIES: type II toxin-antitoxin system RelE/ParE family toxin [unclassified Okeania]NEP03720.1 type II toxin-antitoxin system RelE/ParE family toxin [Okeania sp. SIO4D6]NEP46276.1 type II toxin-antitoxin system RelE/ParE family toxin [Okeania sp. SIO2H7]NEP73209.1 type II toxin-antitoxin system RelE/ParE family toxin [Okeania sp. SIO2G5]NEP94073.1 type II toxin-antitoxin system RelE/ParE family toxin [Okeania sp. SIO2F5]NEQ91904.1 type II toxin-antitoxin system RelE/ParE family toxin 